jgi:hypothetical protein
MIYNPELETEIKVIIDEIEYFVKNMDTTMVWLTETKDLKNGLVISQQKFKQYVTS